MTDLFDVRPEPPESEGMQWQAVDSSQISEIGYESGAEYPLGIKFPQTKKQKENMKNGKPFPLPGSEYHYANVTPEMYAEFLAAKENPEYNNSIGVFFGRVIKGRPELYPFVKVEPENPPHPLDSKNSPLFGDREANGTIDTPSPSTALAIIDTMADDILFTPGAVTDAQLAAGREWYLTEAKKYDISTEKSRTELKRFARPLQKLRTGIEARAKELTGATKRKIAAIDAEKRRLVGLVGGIEDEVLSSLTTWEHEDEARKANMAGIVVRLASIGTAFYTCTETITAAIAELESFDASAMLEYKVGAESAIAASLRVLKPELERRKVIEANEAELAELRKKQAERDEADRLAEQKRQEDARVVAAAEALAAKKVEAVIAEVKQTTRQEVIAELKNNGEPEDADNETSKPEITDPVDDMSVTTVKSLPIAGMVETREQAFNREAIAGLTEFASVDRQSAIRALTAIANGLVPHITITY